MLLKEWKINRLDEDKPLIKRLLSVRGFKEGKETDDFLNPLEMNLLSPNVFCDMQKAVKRISKAIDNGEKILIYGDFDADGLTSTSVLLKTISHLEGDVSYYIPERGAEGHGLHKDVLVKLLVKNKPKVIITVDCAISNIEEIKFINSFGIDVILTDHHEAGEVLPDAHAIINPKAQNSLDDRLSTLEIRYMSSLAGVGVAFKLAQALLEKYDKNQYLYDLLPFVALGTIADIVPLIGENRYYVIKGLDLIAKGKHYGLKRLLDNAGYSNIDEGITAEQVAFGIAPRINASGRLDAVDNAIKVLISDNKQEVELSAIALENFNKIRQDLCNSIFAEADEMAKKIKDNAIVLYKPDWHIGIIGIVASKIVEKYHKPTFLMMYSEETKQIRCSARGVEGVSEINLYEIISNISECLDGYGGHALAAGLSFSPENVAYEDVKKGLIDSVDQALNGKQIIPVLNIDLELGTEDLDLSIIEDIQALAPFGAFNPQPLFATSDMILVDKKLMGSNKDHLKLTLEKNGKKYNAIWWSKGDIGLSTGNKLDIAFSPQINVFNGTTSIQLIIKDIHSEFLVEENIPSAIKIYDHRGKTGILKQINEYLKTTKLNTIVFAENKSVIDQIKEYPEINCRIVNRNNIKKCDSIMFFDYPPNSEIFSRIMSEALPSFVHYMNYNVELSEELLFKTLQGMIRFVCNNKNGVFSIPDSAAFLGVSEDFIRLAIELFQEAGMISISSLSETSMTIELKNHANIKTLLECDLYKDCVLEVSDIKGFKAICMTENAESLNNNIL